MCLLYNSKNCRRGEGIGAPGRSGAECRGMAERILSDKPGKLREQIAKEREKLVGSILC
jgi:hypothetical protein